MDFPTPITEEPPTPILGELARRYVPFQQQDRDPYPARMLHSVPDVGIALNPDLETLSNTTQLTVTSTSTSHPI